jgi:DNA recombination protein RmuC
MKELKELRERLSATFAELSREALKANTNSFLDLANEKLGKLTEQNSAELEKRQQAVTELLKPMQETMGRVGQSVKEFDEKRAESFTAMAQRMTNLEAQEERLRKETSALGEALRKPGVRGAWGEMQLKRVVEFAGLVEHCHFDEQVAISGQDRPDMIVYLPNGMHIVVDAKAPMQAYLEALQVEDHVQREKLMETHVRQIRDRTRLLGQKKYTDQLDKSPDFTVLFLPAESLYSTALSIDPDLIDFGMKNRVILATPTTLIALLMTIAMGWNERSLADNAMELKKECEALYASVCTFLGNYGTVGTALERAVKAYNSSVGTMQSRLLPKARKINELGGFDKEGLKLAENEPSETTEIEARKLNAPEVEE